MPQALIQQESPLAVRIWFLLLRRQRLPPIISLLWLVIELLDVICHQELDASSPNPAGVPLSCPNLVPAAAPPASSAHYLASLAGYRAPRCNLPPRARCLKP